MLQVAAILAAPSDRAFPLLLDPLRIAGWYVTHVLPAALLGTRLAGPPGSVWAAAATLVAAAVAVALAVAAARSRGTRPAPLVALAVWTSLLLWAVPVALTGVATGRYAVAPALLLLAAVVYAADHRRRPGQTGPRTAHPGRVGPGLGLPAAGPGLGPRAARLAPGAGLAFLLLVWTADFPVGGPRADAPRWANEVRAAEAACADGEPAATLDLAPTPWRAEVPCRHLEGR